MVSAIENTGRHIKVFDTTYFTCLYEFKRGIKICTISNVNFDNASNYLGVSSNTGTVHLFFLSVPDAEDTEKKQELAGKKVESKFLDNLKTFFKLETSAAKLHLQQKMGCSWTTKESNLIGPMVSFAKEKGKFVFSLSLNLVCCDTMWITVQGKNSLRYRWGMYSGEEN